MKETLCTSAFEMAGYLDQINQMEITTTSDFGGEVYSWIDKDDAERIIAHLKSVFNIGDL